MARQQVKGAGSRMLMQPNPTVERVMAGRYRSRFGRRKRHLMLLDQSPDARRFRYLLAAGWL